MNIKKVFSRKRILFLVLFSAMVFIGKRINFSAIVGAEKQYFTLFQFFGPVTGRFLGPVFGVIAVLGAQVADFLFAGKSFSLFSLIQLTPMVYAAYYFGKRKKSLAMVIPIIAMGFWMLHPVGRQVWFFSLYWIIPIIVKFLPKKYADNLYLRSLGSTFTAHSVGSTAFLYAVPEMTAVMWIGLIPVVAIERFLFAGGISVSYLVLNAVLDKVSSKIAIPGEIIQISEFH